MHPPYPRPLTSRDDRKLQAGVDGAVVVTTPQEVAMSDVRKELSFCRKTGLRVLGLVENMAGFACPCCGTVTEIFAPSGGGAPAMAASFGVPYAGKVPLDPRLLRACETGEGFVESHPEAPAAAAFAAVVRFVIGQIGKPAHLGAELESRIATAAAAAAASAPKHGHGAPATASASTFAASSTLPHEGSKQVVDDDDDDDDVDDESKARTESVDPEELPVSGR